MTLAGGAKPWQTGQDRIELRLAERAAAHLRPGRGDEVSGIRVTWPSGRVDAIGAVKANQLVVVKEGSGLLKSTPLNRGR